MGLHSGRSKLTQEQTEKRYKQLVVRIGARLEYVIPVVSAAELALLLSNAGYTMGQHKSIPESFGGSKGDAEVYIDGSKRVLGASSPTIETSIATVNEIFDLPTKVYPGTDLRKYASFYEADITAMYSTDNDTYSMMSGVFSDSNDFTKIGKILEGKYVQFSLRLILSGKTHNDKEWHEIIIEPKIGAGNSFIIKAVARSESLTKVLEIAKRTESDIVAIIEKVICK